MASFWTWGLRNPCLLLAGIAVLAGLTGVADWSISLVMAVFLGVVAELAGACGRRARARRKKRLAARQAVEEALDIGRRYRDRAA